MSQRFASNKACGSTRTSMEVIDDDWRAGRRGARR